MAIASCYICIACRKRWIFRNLRSKTDSVKACSTWLGCRHAGLKSSLCSEWSRDSQLNSIIRCPHSRCGHSLMVLFIVCFLPHKKTTRALIFVLHQKQTAEHQNLCKLQASSSGHRSSAGLPLALGLVSTTYPLFRCNTTLSPFLLTTTCMPSTLSLPGKMSEEWVNKGIHRSFQAAATSFFFWFDPALVLTVGVFF